MLGWGGKLFDICLISDQGRVWKKKKCKGNGSDLSGEGSNINIGHLSLWHFSHHFSIFQTFAICYRALLVFFRTSNYVAPQQQHSRAAVSVEGGGGTRKLRVGKLKSSRSIGAAISRNDLC